MKLATIIASFYLIPVLLLLATITTTAANDHHYLLSCGASVTVNNEVSDFDKQLWETDNNFIFSDSFASTAVFTTSTTNIPHIPFATARVFTTNFTYSFPVSPGPKFIRLFFYPSPSPYASSTSNRSFSAADTYLTVRANSHYILLRNFSAYLSFNSLESYGQKEFYVNVNSSLLELTFSPTQSGSLAFVNGIEVVSVPNNLYVGPPPPKNVDNPNVIFDFPPTASLQNAYRVNVGGGELGPVEDGSSMYRSWNSDADKHLPGFQGQTGLYQGQITISYAVGTPNYSAPVAVYQTFRWMGDLTDDFKKTVNVTWRFEVDLGFQYLVRLHWCETVVDMNRTNARVFEVFMNGETAEDHADIFEWAGGSYKAYYKDYVVSMHSREGSGNTGYIELALHPDTKTRHVYLDVLLNGLEIFKISRPDGSLDAPNPSGVLPIGPTPFRQQKTPSHIVPAIIAAVTGVILISVLLCYLFIIRRRKWSKTSDGSSGTPSSKSKGLFFSFGISTGTTKRSSGGGSSLPSHLCRHFSLAEIRLATSDFSQSLIVGHGGFGNVYKGTVNTETGPTPVAIKRLNPLSGQGAREFTTEIELLSKLRHVHLVSLIGYSDDAGEMILVYEFMSRGTLRDHLYPHPSHHLPWTQRLQICVGAARGLHYLHTGTHRMIIHRDVKSTNILVDDKWVAKVSDFGLSKLGPLGGEHTHVSTAVKGSFGYVDPEYYRRQQLTEKSDVYSFGVVLFEVLCGRAAVNPALPKEQVNLRIWARRNQASGTLDTIVDPNLKGQIAPECLRKFGEVAESCVRDEGANRPSMVDVIWGLEFALQLQMEAVAKSINLDTVDEDVFSTNNIASPTTDTTARLIISSDENTWTSVNNSSSGLFSSTTSDRHGGSTDVFSQIFKPEGR